MRRLFDRAAERRESEPTVDRPVASHSILLVGAAAVGAALLAVGLLWGWYSWTNRSATPVDDLLPRLVAGEVEAQPDLLIEQPSPKLNPVGSESAEPVGAAPAVEAPVTVGDGEPMSEPIVIHVAGAVERPGVVELTTDARVFDAIDAAGGARSHADLDRINLASRLVDGERLWVPALGEETPPAVIVGEQPLEPEVTPADVAEPLTVIDLNRATAAAFETLPGIGPALAQAIVTTRAERGPFLAVDELVEVDGIGPAKLEQLRARVVVRAPATSG